METLGGAEFTPDNTYLNTSSSGVLPGRAIAAMTALLGELAAGRPGREGDFSAVAAARRSFARLHGVAEDRVALGGSLSAHVGLIANSLPAGAEVLFPRGDYTSLITPFSVRGDLRLRYAPLADLPDAVRPDTALVAFSSVQSADGRIADLPAVRAAAAAHGARTLVDATQSAGWLPLDAGEWDFTVTSAYKFLLCPHGVSFLTVTEEAQASVAPILAGSFASEDWTVYGPVERLARTARRFDESPASMAYHGAARSLALLEEIGVDAVHAYDTALARRFREGLAEIGLSALPGDSAIVAVPGLGHRAPELLREGIVVSDRAGNLRAAFHLYNSQDDVDRTLGSLARAAAGT
ncbi:aminotransferase class V-fold PLP-dependent enzyme [Streptomyces sp. NPDC004726]